MMYNFILQNGPDFSLIEDSPKEKYDNQLWNAPDMALRLLNKIIKKIRKKNENSFTPIMRA